MANTTAIVLDRYHKRAEILACGTENECVKESEEWASDMYVLEKCTWEIGVNGKYADFDDSTIYIIGTEFDYATLGNQVLVQLWGS